MTIDIPVIMCPPVSTYPVQPKDQSLCTKEKCPKCNQEMWLSEKKKAILSASEAMNIKCFVACYHCIMKEAKNNPEFFRDYVQVNI